MRLALIQEKQNSLYGFHSEGLAFNREEALALQEEMISQNLDLLREAGNAGTDIALTSEAVNYPGVRRLIAGLDLYDLVAAKEQQLLEGAANIARESSMDIVLGVLRSNPNGRLCNAAVVLDRTGHEVMVYLKQFLTKDEEEFLSPGKAFPVWESEFGRIGIAICWDMQFPEVARAYAKRDVDLVLCPTWGWESTYAVARAYENGIYVASAMAVPSYKNICGIRRPSQAIGPDGAVLAEGSYDHAEVLLVDIADITSCAPYRQLRIGDLRRWERGESSASV